MFFTLLHSTSSTKYQNLSHQNNKSSFSSIFRFLLNEKEGFRKRKQKTRAFKHSSSIAVNQIVTFEKIPKKMLNGYLLISAWSGGGMGGGRQLCKIEIEFKKGEW